MLGVPMLTDAELERLLRDAESDRVERKRSLSDPGEVRKAICAFANGLPDHRQAGVVFLGVNDDGTCAGLGVTDSLLLELSQMRDDGAITPIPSLTVARKTIAGCEVAVVVVQPSTAPPVRLGGRTWIRLGPRRATATPEEERRLAERRRHGDLPFDLQPILAAQIGDLDLDLFERTYLPAAVAPEVLTENRRTQAEQLQALRMLDRTGSPTVAGVLTVGKDPRRFVPGAYVQFLRLDGTVLTDPVRDQKEVDGPLPEFLRRLDEILEAHNSTGVSITERPTEVRRPEYPIPALQQIVRNAVMHRTYEATSAPVRVHWYTDRIEVLSPGGPYGVVSRENFGNPGVADYRNPHVAEAMKVLGYVQRFGVGIPIAREEMRKNGNPALEFTIEATHVLATLRRRT
jgi:ATP-dependent DNA helicase RecG